MCCSGFIIVPVADFSLSCSGRATTRSKQRSHAEAPTIESLPVSLPISGLTSLANGRNGLSKAEKTNISQKSQSSHSFVSHDEDSINKESKSQEPDNQGSVGRGRPPKAQRKRGRPPSESPSVVRDAQATSVNGKSDAEVRPGAAHVSVIKRTPEKRGGSRPFGRPSDLHIHAIDTAQIATLLNESPPDTEKSPKKSKSPGRSPAARVRDRQVSGGASNQSKSNQQDGAISAASTNTTDESNKDTSQQAEEILPPAVPKKKGRGRPKGSGAGRGRPKKDPTLPRRPVGRPRKDASQKAGTAPTPPKKPTPRGADSESPQRKKSKQTSSEQSGSPTRSQRKKIADVKGKEKDTSPKKATFAVPTKRAASGRMKNKVAAKRRKNNVEEDSGDSEVEEITSKAAKSGKEKKAKRMVIPPAFPEKDPYDFDALSQSDFEPLPDLRQKRKRRKSKGYNFELESRGKKKKKAKPTTPEDR